MAGLDTQPFSSKHKILYSLLRYYITHTLPIFRRKNYKVSILLPLPTCKSARYRQGPDNRSNKKRKEVKKVLKNNNKRMVILEFDIFIINRRQLDWNTERNSRSDSFGEENSFESVSSRSVKSYIQAFLGSWRSFSTANFELNHYVEL